jgi:multiple sugar transport system ATP-binding protein
LGRAIVRDPKVFLFDEPLSNLDAKLRVQMRVELKKLHERLAVTSIYVTHDQVEAMTLGDRVVVMKDGWVQQVGEPLELYNKPANRFVAGFIGSPAMNFADVVLTETGGRIAAEAQGLKIVLPDDLAARARAKMNGSGTKATLGIRPEDIHLAGTADSSDHCFDANVEVVEQLGSEILLDTRVGPAVMVASVEPTVRVRPHDQLRLALKPERLHLFDPQNEMAI